MKNILVLLLGISLVGCAYEGRTLTDYMEEPQTILRDPHFTAYKEKRDVLERKYLNEEITYAEYMEGLEALDNQYDKEVAQRNAIVTHE
ncbi:MAG: hypothetical protein KC684_01805 [Candidatus Omnitrophica bacterium]|nr:hypothetical protein [Candidatus Omnitrophota bacterium]